MDKLLLLIDTASDKGLVALASQGRVVATRYNEVPAMHAAFVQPAVKELLAEVNVQGQTLAAVAVLNGPGSYTGLRVGLASAKGLCYAWQKPLITIGTLEAMAQAAAMQATLPVQQRKGMLYAPLIDARRMEVYYAVFSHGLQDTLIPPGSAILDHQFLQPYLEQQQVAFFGNATHKVQQVINHPNALYLPEYNTTEAFALLAHQQLIRHSFADLVYAEPLYAKAFYTTAVPLS